MMAGEKQGELAVLSIEREVTCIVDYNALIPKYAEECRARRASCTRRYHEGAAVANQR
jgi:hypothetical protein